MEIHWRNLSVLDETLRARVEERLRMLATDRDDLLAVHISAKTSGHHVHGGSEVSLHATTHGKELVASRTRPDLEQALAEALDAFERELRRVRDRMSERRGRVAAPAEQGVIDRLELAEGYGFILTDGGERVYFHRNALRPELRFEELEEGQRIGLNFEGGEKGLQATVVERLVG